MEVLTLINKQNLWFLTLFSLILVLSIYYLTMPDEVLKTVKTQDNNTKETVNIEESDALTALRVEADEETLKEMNNLQEVLLNESATVDEKNDAYETLKDLNQTKGKEETIENIQWFRSILEKHKLKSFVKIKQDQIQIVISNKEHDEKLANNIIRTVQSNFDTQMYITVKFQS